MMEFWELYVSSFWAWIGITFGLALIFRSLALIVVILLRGEWPRGE